MRGYLGILLCCATVLCAQDNKPANSPQPGSISGTVTMAGTGAPIPNVAVDVNRNGPKSIGTVTDDTGHYVLRNLEPGPLRISASMVGPNGRPGFGAGGGTRQVTLQPGQEITGFNFKISVAGRITGKVVDQNKEPVPGVSVYLVTREYVAGTLRAVLTSGGFTDDQGEYTLERVQPGRAYAVLAKRRPPRLDPISDSPADPRLRLPAVMPTYYPNAPSLDGAQFITVRSGERRENVDIRLVRTPSYCVEAQIDGLGRGARQFFEVSETQPTSGTSGDGGFYTSVPGGTPGPDGKLRLCNLHPGDYELDVSEAAAEQLGKPPSFGTVNVTLTDHDIDGVHITARPRIPVTGDVVWAGDPPETPPTAKLNVLLQALSRTERGGAQTAIPSHFEIPDGLLLDEFSIDVRGVPAGVYIKDMRYGDDSVLYAPLRAGHATGDGALKIVLARDGGIGTGRVLDKDQNPVPECNVVFLPAAASSEAVLAASMVTGKTDQSGTWSSPTLAPGKYWAFATEDVVNKSFETVAKLWRLRGHVDDVTVTANSGATVNLTPKPLE